MAKNSAYFHLAKWFEYLNDDCGYQQWSQYLISQIKPYAPVGYGLDIGCGGGWFTRAFQNEGYQMTGMDASMEMLNAAEERALTTGIRSQYVLGDITSKKMPCRFHFASAINDCINYVPKDKIEKAFKNVAASLKKGGVFLFDISSKRKFQEKMNNTVSVDDREDVTYLAFYKPDGDTMTIDVTLFVRRKDGAFDRLEETHTQYVYEEKEIVDALIKAGFTIINVEGFLGEDKKQADRICFLARKE